MKIVLWESGVEPASGVERSLQYQNRLKVLP
jgi:hypothetical protein